MNVQQPVPSGSACACALSVVRGADRGDAPDAAVLRTAPQAVSHRRAPLPGLLSGNDDVRGEGEPRAACAGPDLRIRHPPFRHRLARRDRAHPRALSRFAVPLHGAGAHSRRGGRRMAPPRHQGLCRRLRPGAGQASLRNRGRQGLADFRPCRDPARRRDAGAVEQVRHLARQCRPAPEADRERGRADGAHVPCRFAVPKPVHLRPSGRACAACGGCRGTERQDRGARLSAAGFQGRIPATTCRRRIGISTPSARRSRRSRSSRAAKSSASPAARSARKAARW